MMHEPFPIYIPPPPPPDKKSLSADLTWAIKNRNAAVARKTFDTAFWMNIPLVPDWHHLLCAVVLKDPAMVRLLAAHGALWTEGEARGLKEIFPRDWPEFVAVLHSGGIRADMGDLSQPADLYTRVGMARRILAEDQDILPNILIKEDTDSLLSEAILRYLVGGEIKNAAGLLLLRQAEGDLNVDREMEEMLKRNSPRAEIQQALKTLATIRHHYGIGIKGQKVDAALAAFRPEIIHDLYLYALLDDKQPDRLLLIRPWRAAATEKDYQGYKTAADVLFRLWRPLSAEEADIFIQIYKETGGGNGKAMSRICDDLNATDFFKGKAWTAGRLGAMSALAEEGSSLKKHFNQRIAEDRFRGMSEKDLLRPENFSGFVEAHKKGYYKADYRQMYGLLNGLHGQYKDGQIPANVAEDLRTLKTAIPDFTAFFHANSFYGRKEPGLAKILLELNILRPDEFSLVTLRELAKLPEKGRITDVGKNTGKYVDFFCQVFLESYFPQESLPLRGKNISYRDKMIEKYPPPPPPKPPEHFSFFPRRFR